MLQETLINAGLTPAQAEILLYLLKNKMVKASEIAKNTQKPREAVYKSLEKLVELGLAEKIDKTGKVILFRAEHPGHLESLFENKEKAVKTEKQYFLDQLPELVSDYNLANEKPGVRFYEGSAGIEKILNDTLTSKTVIYTYADIEAVEQTVSEINRAYAQKREHLNIKKKIIVADTLENRIFFKEFNKDTTDIKFIKKEFYQFNSGMQIYDNKISFQTLEKDRKVAVLIEDKNIYEMQKKLFEYIWETL